MLNKFLKSGIIERYCLNDVSVAEREEVDLMCKKFEVVRNEIAIFQKNLALSSAPIAGSLSKVKYRLMRKVYESSAKNNCSFLPLMDLENYQDNLEKVIQQNNLQASLPFDGNLKIVPLPSTIEVENAAVWIKEVFNEEIHYQENEYIHIVKGSCIMSLNGEKKTYKEGDLIFIPPYVKHSAKIISTEPMFALVQRQLLAQA